jgi:lipid II:glycine glycyltransferase (peptidoglycan interpeptide bridge formation enzyme)
MKVRELVSIEEHVFDQRASHPLQLFAWGSIRTTTGIQVVRFGVYEGEVLVETYQMTLHKVPGVARYVGYIPRSRMPSKGFLEYLESYCKKYKIISVLFEPDEVRGKGAAPTAPLQRSSTALFYRFTRVIDLTKPIEALKKELDATARYNIGLAERKGVLVSVEDTQQGFEDFYSLYEITTKRQNFGGHTKTYHQTIWNEFSDKGIAHILVARHGGRPLAACEVWLYNGTLYYTYAGSSTEQRNLKAMNALLWQVILFGKDHGATKLDLWGILPPGEYDPNEPWAGFSDFKKGYGGEVVEMIGSYDFIMSPVFHALYVLGYKLRKLFRAWI